MGKQCRERGEKRDYSDSDRVAVGNARIERNAAAAAEHDESIAFAAIDRDTFF